jgi:hypothetical protein
MLLQHSEDPFPHPGRVPTGLPAFDVGFEPSLTGRWATCNEGRAEAGPSLERD